MKMRLLGVVFVASGVAAASCTAKIPSTSFDDGAGLTGTGATGSGGTSTADLTDADGDGISDTDEGAAAELDSDDDGTPDYLDEDSDDDGIPDSEEAGDSDPATPRVDSDNDGTPDFQDLDSDNNGIDDATEGTADPDNDGTGDYADADNDGDTIIDTTEIGGDPSAPLDSDDDGTPDYLDLDSDNDTISDADEKANDPDDDGIPSYIDLDSDEDCVPDELEAGDADLATAPVDTDNDGQADFHDTDSDDDGLSDTFEDVNCNGLLDPGESSAFDEDTDDDGVSDLVENAAGTDPADPADNPQINGDFVFVVPYEEPPTPDKDDLDFTTDLKQVDVYTIIDRSGSMTQELTSIKNNIDTVADNVTCAPLGNGAPGECIPDIWWGAGTVGYAGTGGQPFTNHLDLQEDPNIIGTNIPTDEPTGCCAEPLLLSTWSTLTGNDATTAPPSGCAVDNYPARLDCTNSPAGVTGIGYPCFRSGALPIILLVTDESPTTGSNTLKCPAESEVVTEATALSARVVGIMGDGAQPNVATLQGDLESLATQTGAVDANNSNAPLVMAGGGASAAQAIEDAIKLLAAGVPLDLSAVTVDDPSDNVDAVDAFVDHLETLQLGTPECTDGLTDIDSDPPDGFKDQYLGVTAGTPVCWRLIPKQNTTVMPTDQPQLFQATVEVYGDGITLLDERDVYFVVPPGVEVEPPPS